MSDDKSLMKIYEETSEGKIKREKNSNEIAFAGKLSLLCNALYMNHRTTENYYYYDIKLFGNMKENCERMKT